MVFHHVINHSIKHTASDKLKIWGLQLFSFKRFVWGTPIKHLYVTALYFPVPKIDFVEKAIKS